MSVYLTCKKCGHKFAASTIEYLSGELKCPKCGVKDSTISTVLENGRKRKNLSQ